MNVTPAGAASGDGPGERDGERLIRAFRLLGAERLRLQPQRAAAAGSCRSDRYAFLSAHAPNDPT
jgi:hypothetical protein